MKTRAVILLRVLCGAFLMYGCATSRLDRHVAAQQRLDTTIAALASEARQLRAGRDSLSSQNDSLRQLVEHLQADLLDREEQIRSLRLELERLKEIDLKRPRRTP